ncbi:MAG: ABC transporter ATP-binding protein/permease [Clostridiales bacterium]|nr:ABC transporter ATP-binding protein/permease [Clostridiales bacterium]
MKRLRTLHKLIRDARRHSRALFVYFAANILLTAVFSIAVLYAPRMLVDELLGARRVEAIIIIAAAFLVAAGVSGFFLATMKTSYQNTLKTFRASLLRRAQRKDLTRNYAELEDPARQDESWFAQRGVTNFSTGAEGICSRLFVIGAAVVTLLLYIWILFALHYFIGLFIIAGAALLFLYSLRQNKAILEEEKRLSPLERKNWYMYEVTSDYQYGKDIRVFGLRDWLLSRFASIQRLIYPHVGAMAKARWRMDLADTLFGFLRGGAVYGYLIYAILQGTMRIADFTLYFAAVTLFSAALKQLFDGLAFIGVQIEQVEAYYDFVEMPDEFELSGKQPVPEEGGLTLEFRDLRFRYPSTERDIFDKLHLTIQAGERLAVVGVNGAGKTTLIKLLTRLYAPDEGEILLNGVNIREYELHGWRNLFSVISQEINLIATTLGENVALSANYDAARVESALRRAGFGEKLDSFEKGLQTQILKSLAEDGVELSGGERQKLAIARALYRDGRILVMDEPTAALDAIAEHALYSEFAEMTRGKTAIFISHRLASTRFCDKILLLDGAGKTEFGTHAELMELGGVYRHMFDTQRKYYAEEVADEGA